MSLLLPLDPMDFPLIPVPVAGVAVHLFPVTKVQLEYMLGDVQRFDAAVYTAMIEVNPRTSWRSCAERPVTLFATGILPHEAESFANWMGPEFRLPTDQEWQAIDAAFDSPADPQMIATVAASPDTHPTARSLLLAQADVRSLRWRDVGMFDGGLLEWVRCRTGFGLHGRPRLDLYRVIHNPQIHPAVRVNQNPAPRHRAFGFRLVRPLPTGRKV